MRRWQRWVFRPSVKIVLPLGRDRVEVAEVVLAIGSRFGLTQASRRGS